MLSKRTALLLAILSALLLTEACPREPAAAPNTIVTVGTRNISRDDFTRYLERNAGTALNQLTAPAASALLEQYVEEILLAEHAADSGMAVSSAAVAEALRNDPGSTPVEKRDELERSRFLSDVSAKAPAPAEAEIAAYYNAHPEEFRAEEQVHVRQILVHTESDAKAAREELARGETFEAVSKKYSKAPNAERGGDVGFVERGQLPQVFESAIFALAPGAVSDVIRTDSNFFHIFKVDEKRPAGRLSLSEARPLIEERLREEKLRVEVANIVAQTAKEKKVTVFTPRLGFTYTGHYPVSNE